MSIVSERGGINMLTVTAVPKMFEGAGYGQLGEAKGGNGKPRHLRFTYIPARRQRNNNTPKQQVNATIANFSSNIGRGIDVYA